MEEINAQQRFSRANAVDITELPDGYMVTDQNSGRVHYLNPVAAIIFELCDGTLAASEIAEFLMREFTLDSAPHAQVHSCLDTLVKQNLATPCPS